MIVSQTYCDLCGKQTGGSWDRGTVSMTVRFNGLIAQGHKGFDFEHVCSDCFDKATKAIHALKTIAEDVPEASTLRKVVITDV